MPCRSDGTITENVKGAVKHVDSRGLYYVDWEDGKWCEDGVLEKYLTLVYEPNNIMKKLL